MGEGGSRVVRFGAFELDPASGELRKHGTRIRLQEQQLKGGGGISRNSFVSGPAAPYTQVRWLTSVFE